MFGLIGHGYPNSFYKVFVRAKPGSKWWKFEWGVCLSYNPIVKQNKIKVNGRAPVIWAPLGFMSIYTVDPERPGLILLYERANKLLSDVSPSSENLSNFKLDIQRKTWRLYNKHFDNLLN